MRISCPWWALVTGFPSVPARGTEPKPGALTHEQHPEHLCRDTDSNCPRSQLQLGSFSTGRSFWKGCRSQNSFPAQPQSRINERKGMTKVRSKWRCVQCKGMGLSLCVGIQIILNLLSPSWALIKRFRSSSAEYFPSWIFLLLYFFSLQFSRFNGD